MRNARVWMIIGLAITLAQRGFAIDSNGDGMDDVWAAKYGVPVADAGADYDGDGLTNAQESAWGTNPRDINSRPLLQMIWDSSTQLRLRINTELNKSYQVEQSNDLVTWTNVGSAVTGTGGQVDLVVSLSDPAVTVAFFRYRVIDIDADADGLSAWDENQIGTSDTNSDTDGDGMPDGWEYRYGLNPLNNDANQDLDGDGLTNLQEYQNGSDPTDYYNGITPVLTLVHGDAQTARPNTFLQGALVAQVTNSSGQVLSNAPVTFTSDSGGVATANDSGATVNSSLVVRTGSDGWANVYFKTPNADSTNSISVSTKGAAAANFNANTSSAAPTPAPLPTPNSESATIWVTVQSEPLGTANYSIRVGTTTTTRGRFLNFQRGQSYSISIVRTSGTNDKYDAHVIDFNKQYTLIDDPNGILGDNLSYAQKAGQTATMTLPKVQLITPTGDPVGSANDSYGADGQNEFTFGSSLPGWLTIPMKALVTPSGFANRIRGNVAFSVGASGANSPTVDPVQASGDYLVQKWMFQGLPSSGGAFGLKYAAVNLRQSDATPDYPDASRDDRQCEIFFPKTATNHPSGQANSPNWFYYWGMTSANKASSSPMDYIISLLPGQYRLEEDKIHLSDDAANVTSPRAWNNAKGIDCYGWTTAHENKHRTQLRGFWTSGQRDPARDLDGDYIPDDQEANYMPGRPYQTNTQFTYVDDIGYYPVSGNMIPDVEDIDMRSQTQQGGQYLLDQLWTPGSANGQDWANPGKNARNQF